ncbi:MAG: aldo/keto reductase, partial [Ruminococcus sp.]|nr:aldo/keto reductase [Ruminococcus sp.]
MNDVKAVIGTNSWGGKAYGKLLRGSYVEDDVIRKAMAEAEKRGLMIYDLARDYGLGKAQK